MEKELIKNIGRKIKESRTQKKLTQEELAEETEISPSFLGMIERGQRIPSIMTIRKLCDVLNISVDSLFELQPETIKERKPRYEGKEEDPIIERIIKLLKDKKEKDKELALKLLKKIFRP